MKIIIKDSNREKIEKALSEIQGRAKVRTLSYKKIKSIIDREIEHCEKYGVPKCAIEGLKISYMPDAARFPQAYKYTPEATFVTIEFGKNATPYLIDIGRDRCDTPTSVKKVLNFPQSLKDKILEKFEKSNAYVIHA